MNHRCFLIALSVVAMAIDCSANAATEQCFPTLEAAQAAHPEAQHFWQRQNCYWIRPAALSAEQQAPTASVRKVRSHGTGLRPADPLPTDPRPVSQPPPPEPVESAPPPPVTVGAVYTVQARIADSGDSFRSRFEAVREAHIPQDLSIALGRRAAAVWVFAAWPRLMAHEGVNAAGDGALSAAGNDTPLTGY
jgi:hypothetical protein